MVIQEEAREKLVEAVTEFLWDRLPTHTARSDWKDTPSGPKTQMGLANCILRIVRENQPKQIVCDNCGCNAKREN